MIPLQDVNPTHRRPWLTWLLIAVNVAVFLYQLTLSERQLAALFMDFSVVPRDLTRLGWFAEESLLDVLRSMFFHGGWLHLGSNMLYLWVFGDNIEDRFGKLGFLVLYLVSGFAAAYAQVLIDPNLRIPLVGASGAIAGVLGAYILLFPNARVRTLVLWIVVTITEVRALWLLGFWFLLQLLNGFVSLGADTASGGVAFFAHIGGFVAGLVLALVFRPLLMRERIGEGDYLYRSDDQYTFR